MKVAVLHWPALVLVNNAVQQIIQLPLFMIASLHRIKLKQ